MKHYLIYYITTNTYINYADTFFTSLSNFMPNNLIDVIWLSDNFISIQQNNNINIIQKYIVDMPWPLVTLLKMHYIYNNKLSAYDGYFYFNANSIIHKMSDNAINIINDSLKNNKFICSYHSFHPLSQFHDNKLYCQAGFFGGNYQVFYDICNKCVNKINDYLQTRYIPKYHDETVLNEVISELSSTYSDDILTFKGFMKFYDLKDININNDPYYFIELGNGQYKKYKTYQ